MRRTEAWQIDYLYSIGAVNWAVHVGVVTLTYFVMQSSQGGSIWQAWYLLMLAGSVFLMGCSVIYQHTRLDGARRVQLGWAHTGATSLIGLVWGLGAVASASAHADVVLYYTLVLGGTVLGAVSSQHAVPRSCLLSIWTAVPMLALAQYLHQPHARGYALAAMVLLYGVVLTRMSTRMHGFLREKVAMAAQMEDRLGQLQLITAQLLEARKLADESNQSKSRLLAQASHDLRQPVHAIGVLVECLRDFVAGRDGQQLIERIEQSLAAVSALFKTLLDSSALDTGNVRPRETVFPVARVLDDVIRQSAHLARERAVQVRVVGCAAHVRTDPALLLTMVLNLVSNAIKYGDGRVLVGCRQRGGELQIEVHNTGRAIPARDLSRIFDEFVRAGTAEQVDQREGLGLGLSIVRRVARLLRVQVRAVSHEGRGSVFCVGGIALAPPGPEPRLAAGNVGLSMSILAGFRVVVVDDDQAVREALGALLQRWGCDASVHPEPPDLAELTDADFLLMDYELGGARNGLDVIRECAGAGDVRAAVMTGTVSSELERQAHQLGVVVFAKPVMPAQLRSLLLTAASRETAGLTGT
ncbi:MAG: ATP-binding protein [Ramlibacter sp.]